MIDDLDNADCISSNVNSSRQEALLYVIEDNEAVIKMIMKGRRSAMRHVSNHPLRHTPSLLYLESGCDEIWRNHIREGICVTPAASEDFLER